MFGWFIRMTIGDRHLWYNGKRQSGVRVDENGSWSFKDERGCFIKQTEPCWSDDQQEAVLWSNHERAFQVKRKLGKKAEIVDVESEMQELR